MHRRMLYQNPSDCLHEEIDLSLLKNMTSVPNQDATSGYCHMVSLSLHSYVAYFSVESYS